MNQNELQTEVRRRLEINEGVETTMYHDSKGIPTIGVGFNLTRGDAASQLKKVGADYNAVMARKPITQKQVDQLLAVTLNDFEDGKSLWQCAHDSIPLFDHLTDARKAAICDLVYNLGFGGWMEFAPTRHLINQGQMAKDAGHQDAHSWFSQAADHILASSLVEDTGDRARRNAEMIRDGIFVNPNGDGSN